MERDPALTAAAITALSAVLADPSQNQASVVVAGQVPTQRFEVPSAQRIDATRMPAHLRACRGATVVAVGELEPAIQRALIDHPPALLVVTGAIDPSARQALRNLPQTLVLGPHGVLRVGHGQTIACAQGVDELEGLRRTLGEPDLRLALAPTPSWLLHWLEHESLADLTVAGYVPAQSLDGHWARWAQRCSDRHVLVPIGVEPPPHDLGSTTRLEAVVAAHGLERFTGPVFPSPRVIATVVRGFGQSHEASPGARGVWTQARRALPMTGTVVGMEQPHPRLPSGVPTATFLAQRALLRRERCRALLRTELEPHPAEQSDKRERAHEVLAGAGQVLSDHESKVVLRGFGIHITRQAVAGSASGAAQYAETIGFPVVLKGVSPDLRRKREIGAVLLDLDTSAAVRRGYATIARNVAQHAPTARLDGVLVAEMIGDGLDLHCGGLRMKNGDVALYGKALASPEPFEPVFALSPLHTHNAVLLAHAVLSRIPVPALRRETDPDAHLLAQLFLQLDGLFRATGTRLLQVELNPVRLEQSGRGYVTLDARIVQRAHLEGT